jgi:hypothetical protein
MFVADELVLDIEFQAAQARLVNLAREGALSGVSEAVYEDGLSAVIRVGPFGDVPGASKLVRVRFLEPVYRGDAMRLGLRWEATGVTSGLFPVLDADISVTPAAEHATKLALAGSYRVPLGTVGAGLDRALLHRVATSTIRALLREVADALASPGTAPARRTEALSDRLPRPLIEPGMP